MTSPLTAIVVATTIVAICAISIWIVRKLVDTTTKSSPKIDAAALEIIFELQLEIRFLKDRIRYLRTKIEEMEQL